MQLTNEQQRLLRGMFPDEDGILREDVEQAIEEFLTAQTSSYSAAIEKMKTYCHKDNAKKGCVTCFARMEDNKVLDHVQNTLFTEGKV